MNAITLLHVALAHRGEYIQFVQDGVDFTNAQVERDVKAFATALSSAGVLKGDRVAMVLPTTYANVISIFATWYVGGIAVPLDFSLARDELHKIFSDCEPKAIVTDEASLENALHAASEMTFVKAIYIDGAQMPGTISVSEAIAEIDGNLKVAECAYEDTATLLYTSGSTGEPKGVMLTHQNIWDKGRPKELGEDFMTLPDKPAEGTIPFTMLLSLPLAHVFGFIMIQNIFAYPTKVVLLPRFRLDTALDLIEKYRVNLVPTVPTVFRYILNYHEREFDISSVFMWVSGSAALPESTATQWEKRFGIKILQGYGLTEASATVSMNMGQDWVKPGSIGQAWAGVELKIVDPEGNELPRGEVGEVCIKGGGVMKGYYNKPELTKEVLKDGWLHTGDVGRIDGDGFIFIIDRIKDLIIRGGMNVYPREVEEVLHMHPDVRDAAVVGIPDDEMGEEIVGFVSMKDDCTFDEANIRAYVSEHLAKYKVPREVRLVQDMPKTEVGKIIKRQLKELYP
ncbi:MAG: AMP-binding protein [Planctomycetes bacterium]|nr:AMP-binding protein [Planctomycetota bacterium]